MNECSEVPWEYNLTVEKLASDRGGDLYIAGYASNGNEDEDGEVMDLDSLKKVYSEYMKNPVIKLMHDKVPQWKGAIGRVVPDYTDLEGNIHKTSFSSKPYLVIKLAKGLPEWIYSSVEEGIYKGLSIGGKLAMKIGNKLYVKSWLETSLVDIPSAKGSFVNVLKAAGSSINDEEDEPTMLENEGISKSLNSLWEVVQARRLEESSSGLEAFLKGGKGSGIKGHVTYREKLAAKYKKDSQDLTRAYQDAMKDIAKLDERGRDLVERGERMIKEGEEASKNTGSSEGEKKEAQRLINQGKELRDQGNNHIADSATKSREFTNKHTEAQAKLSQKYLDDLKAGGLLGTPVKAPTPVKSPESPEPTKEEPVKEEGISKEEAKKQARRERARKRREAAKSGIPKPTFGPAQINPKELSSKVEKAIQEVFPRYDAVRPGGDRIYNPMTVSETKDGFFVDATIDTGLRGSRTDMGWDTSAEQNDMYNQVKSRMQALEVSLQSKGLEGLKVSFDYGEKGDVTIQVYGEVKANRPPDPRASGEKPIKASTGGRTEEQKAKQRERARRRREAKSKEPGEAKPEEPKAPAKEPETPTTEPKTPSEELTPRKGVTQAEVDAKKLELHAVKLKISALAPRVSFDPNNKEGYAAWQKSKELRIEQSRLKNWIRINSIKAPLGSRPVKGEGKENPRIRPPRKN